MHYVVNIVHKIFLEIRRVAEHYTIITIIKKSNFENLNIFESWKEIIYIISFNRLITFQDDNYAIVIRPPPTLFLSVQFEKHK